MPQVLAYVARYCKIRHKLQIESIAAKDTSFPEEVLPVSVWAKCFASEHNLSHTVPKGEYASCRSNDSYRDKHNSDRPVSVDCGI